MAEYLKGGIISIKADIEEAQAFLTELGYQRKSINKALLRAVGTGGRQAIRRNYKSVLKKRTGKLYKEGIKSFVKQNGTAVVFTNNVDSGEKTSKDGRLARYGFMLASGYTIKPKHGKALMWEEDGQKFFAKKITVKPKDWVEGPIKRYAESMDIKQHLNKAFQKQVDK